MNTNFGRFKMLALRTMAGDELKDDVNNATSSFKSTVQSARGCDPTRICEMRVVACRGLIIHARPLQVPRKSLGNVAQLSRNRASSL